MIRPAVVIIAYNRIESLKRLLTSIDLADYPKDTKVQLIISIDRAEDESNKDILNVANDFMWMHGEKQVIYRDKNLGLKQHVLTCGDLSGEYGSVILLEDDLYVSPAYYQFACEALEFADNDDRIGGVSLYNHRLNVHVREPFLAVDDGFDNWYFQFASSWGQAVTATQWVSFRAWLKEHETEELAGPGVPANVAGWSDKSWLKYHIKYLIDKNRYFLYPTMSYTTNFADEGTHAKEMVTDLQVPLSGRRQNHPFSFVGLDDTKAVYDAYFENAALLQMLPEMVAGEGISAENLLINMYGYKPMDESKRFVLSPQALPNKRIAGYARALRPIDDNVFQNVEGNDFYLYDMSKEAELPKMNEVGKLLYYYRALKARNCKAIIKYRVRQRFKRS